MTFGYGFRGKGSPVSQYEARPRSRTRKIMPMPTCWSRNIKVHWAIPRPEVIFSGHVPILEKCHIQIQCHHKVNVKQVNSESAVDLLRHVEIRPEVPVLA